MRKCILILDDDTALLDVLKILLNDNGYDAVLIAQTDDLFSLVQLHQPSLILLDYRLNGRDGGDWCARLKSHPQFKTIPVILFTACTTKLAKGSYGCDDFIPKPFDIDDMLDRIKQLIGEGDALVEEEPEIIQRQDEFRNRKNGY